METNQLTRQQLVAIIAKLRGDLESIRQASVWEPKEVEDLVETALEWSAFDVSSEDLIDDQFAELPEEMI